MDKSPDAFRTISEVAEHLDTPAHVLRFWESRFPQIKPVKRAGGRRYYRPSDMALLTGIKQLLHDDGLTIRGVQKILREQGVRHVAGLSGHTDGLAPDDHHIDIVMEPPAKVEATATILSFDTALPEPDRHDAGARATETDELWPDADLAPPEEVADFGPELTDLPLPEHDPQAAFAASDVPDPSDPEPTAPDDEQFLALLAEVNKTEDVASQLSPNVTSDGGTPGPNPSDAVLAAVTDTSTKDAAMGTAPPARSDDTWRSIPLAQGEEMPLASRLRAMPAGALSPRAPEIAAWISRAADLARRMSEPVRPGRN